MKVLSRDFTLKERVLLIVLALILMAFGYYFFVDQSVRSGIASANADYDMYSEQLSALQIKLTQLDTMQQEMDKLENDKTRMPSYNANRQEIDFLNAILAGTQDYTVTFSDATREGDQIRRNFTLQFSVANAGEARNILAALSGSELRCRLGNVNYTTSATRNADEEDVQTVRVSVSAVFYETMVGGTADAGLPADTAATGTNTDTPAA